MTELLGLRVHVYRNLRKGGWSIRYRGKVVDVRDKVALRDAEFRIRKSGRERAIKEGQRNIHAYVCGTVVEGIESPPLEALEVTYNPFDGLPFHIKASGEPVYDSPLVSFEKTALAVRREGILRSRFSS